MRKMDEMERGVTLQAIKWSWFFTVVFLFAWQVYDFAKGNALGIHGFLFLGQFLVFSLFSSC